MTTPPQRPRASLFEEIEAATIGYLLLSDKPVCRGCIRPADFPPRDDPAYLQPLYREDDEDPLRCSRCHRRIV